VSVWKISAGTAGVLGVNKVRSLVAPTTAYVMLGEKCCNNCQFCAQARDSQANNNLLSRITWQALQVQLAASGIADAYKTGKLRRACLQVVNSTDGFSAAVQAVGRLQTHSSIPVCVSSHIESVEQARCLIDAGAERICIALDAATPDIYTAVKDGDWQAKRELLRECSRAFPGRITTHLIVGLGETEEEMVDTLAALISDGITVGLFAFTPIRGTAMAERQPPPIGQYRRIQVACHLLKNDFDRAVIQCAQGKIVGFSVPCLSAGLTGGKAFETSGCPDCNRPFYNERPGGVMYNYPRKLTAEEFRRAVDECQLTEGIERWTGG